MANKPLLKPTEQELQNHIFRGLFRDEKDEEITQIVWTYFTAVQKRWPIAWDDTSNKLMLNKTNGVRAFLKFLKPAYKLNVDKIGDNVPVSKYVALFERVSLKDADFTTDNFKPGAGGEGTLIRRLYDDTGTAR